MSRDNHFLLVSNSQTDSWQQKIKEVVVLRGSLRTTLEEGTLALIEQQDFDLIIIDSTNIKDASQLVSKIKGLKPDARIIVATASPTWRRAADAFRLGAIDYIRKSSGKREILSVLKKAIQNPPSEIPIHSSNLDLIEVSADNRKGEVGNMEKCVLFVDNNEDFLDSRSELLTRSGFRVLKATSIEQANHKLRDYRVHIMIIDVRLRDDSDERDISGLDLAKQMKYQSIPKIILTRYPSYEYVRKAMAPSEDGPPPAIDFLAKQDGKDALIQTVKRVFVQHVKINWDLVIHWNPPPLILQIVKLIEPKLDIDHLSDRTDEFQDLFRRLFYESSEITINRLLSYQDGRVTLAVCSFSVEGVENHFLVTCGQRQLIQEEGNQYKKFVPQAIREDGTGIDNLAETTHFGAIAYKLIHTDLQEPDTLNHFYHANSAEKLEFVLNHLFSKSLAPWYKQGRYVEKKKSLKEFFFEWFNLQKGIAFREKLEHQINDICRKTLATGLARVDCSPDTFIWNHPEGFTISCPNPILYFTEFVENRSSLLCGTTYGQLTGNGVLVVPPTEARLIDFSGIDQGPLVRDFATLETTIKFGLLTIQDLNIRYELERRLLSISHLDESVDDKYFENEAKKTVQMINVVRQQATTILGRDSKTYLEALLLCAIHQIAKYTIEMQHTRRELIPYSHALLSAAMIYQELTSLTPRELPSQAFNSIWIDEANEVVWVEGKKVELAPTEYKLLLLFYNKPNQLCTRHQIGREIYGIDYGPEIMDALNTTVTRLRKKIELNPGHREYIKTVRGRGYKLEMPTEPD